MSEKKPHRIRINTEEAADAPDSAEPAAEEGNAAAPLNGDEENAGKMTPEAEIEARLQAKEAEVEETRDRLLRVSADFENYKKRSAREASEFRKYANQALLKEMLPVVDNLELAISSTEGKSDFDRRLREGMEMTRNEILKVFEKFHVRPIEAVGKPFDPEFHEAVMREESDAVSENTVVSEFQKGYLIHERLLRPAMVVVAAPKTANGDPGNS